jgi:prepilin-type processing-associated H-X9-DG protein
MSVTWPSTVSASQGTGTVRLWLLVNLSVTAGTGAAGGNLKLSGKTQSCGTTLPPLSLNAAGQLVAGGSMVQVTFPASVWSAPSMPKFDTTGTASGWDPGSTLVFDPVLALIGVALPDPNIAWPSSSWTFPSGVRFPDDDGDGQPGITAVPLSGNGHVLPPTGLGVFGSAPTADKIYIATRNKLSFSGTRSSCTDAAGTANVAYFDNHVVGCHVSNGSNCTTGSANTQADFVDQSRTVYAISNASFVAKQLATTATCADVLTTLP